MRKTTIALLAAFMFATVACGGGDDAATTTAAAFTGDPVAGLELYRGTCIVCHGEGGIGIEGLGKPWVGSTFINERTDAEMLAFLQVGRPADDPENTTGIAMLPRGGNPNLTDDDLLDLIAYMRTLNL
jgi:disulfide bond formation protein DsbB